MPSKQMLKIKDMIVYKNKSNSTAGATQVEENLQGQLSDRSVCGVFLLFDLLILAHVISFTAMVNQGRYL